MGSVRRRADGQAKMVKADVFLTTLTTCLLISPRHLEHAPFRLGPNRIGPLPYRALRLPSQTGRQKRHGETLHATLESAAAGAAGRSATHAGRLRKDRLATEKNPTLATKLHLQNGQSRAFMYPFLPAPDNAWARRNEHKKTRDGKKGIFSAQRTGYNAQRRTRLRRQWLRGNPSMLVETYVE